VAPLTGATAGIGRAVARRLAAAAGDVDILVNNAGLYQFGGTADVDDEVFGAHIDVNIRAPSLLV
jgi:short-subunit dehydrogenase